MRKTFTALPAQTCGDWGDRPVYLARGDGDRASLQASGKQCRLSGQLTNQMRLKQEH